MAHLRRRRRRPDRRRDGRADRRARARHAPSRLPRRRHPQRPRVARRSDRPRARNVPRVARRAEPRSHSRRSASTTMLDTTVIGIDDESVQVRRADGSESRLPTRTTVWAAGVTASPLARLLAEAAGGETDRAGRLTVEPDLTLPGHPEVFAIGDMVAVRRPATARASRPSRCRRAAMSPARSSEARTRRSAIATRETWRRSDASRAVADIKGLHFSGFPAWVLWLGLHLFYLIGFQNRLRGADPVDVQLRDARARRAGHSPLSAAAATRAASAYASPASPPPHVTRATPRSASSRDGRHLRRQQDVDRPVDAAAPARRSRTPGRGSDRRSPPPRSGTRSRASTASSRSPFPTRNVSTRALMTRSGTAARIARDRRSLLVDILEHVAGRILEVDPDETAVPRGARSLDGLRRSLPPGPRVTGTSTALRDARVRLDHHRRAARSRRPRSRASARRHALDVASARQPGNAASTFALATSQAFGSTRSGGSRCSRRKSVACSSWLTVSTYPPRRGWDSASVGRLGAARDPRGEERVDDLVQVSVSLDQRGGGQPRQGLPNHVLRQREPPQDVGPVGGPVALDDRPAASSATRSRGDAIRRRTRPRARRARPRRRATSPRSSRSRPARRQPRGGARAASPAAGDPRRPAAADRAPRPRSARSARTGARRTRRRPRARAARAASAPPSRRAAGRDPRTAAPSGRARSRRRRTTPPRRGTGCGCGSGRRDSGILHTSWNSSNAINAR